MTPTTRPSQQPHRPITSTGKYLLSGHHSITFSFEFYLPALSRILHSCSFFHLSPAFPISLSTIIKRHWLLFRDLLFFWTELIQLSIPSADFLSPSKNIWSTLHSDSNSLAPLCVSESLLCSPDHLICRYLPLSRSNMWPCDEQVHQMGEYLTRTLTDQMAIHAYICLHTFS